MVTINDIAKMAGVAKSTVSRYINGGSVSQKTKDKIDIIIKETGYVPNTFAQSLKMKNTNMIGTIIPRLNSYAANEILTSVDEELLKRNYHLLITNTDQEVERELENLYSLARQKVAGILLMATVITPAHIEAIKKIGIPVILLGQRSDVTYSIIHDDFAAGKSIGEHVVALGHKEILYLGVRKSDEAVGITRRQGIFEGLKSGKDLNITEVEVNFDYTLAFNFLKDYLKTSKATYIICTTDNIALAAYKAILINGKKIPDDVSVSGFGGYGITDLVTPAITTVKYPFKEMGRIAVENLLRIIQGEELPKCIILSNEFIWKESTRKLES